jgi:hypothetical protein
MAALGPVSLASPAMADSLTRIAATGGEAFYRGELAEKMVARHACSMVHVLDDFGGHACDWVRRSRMIIAVTVHEILQQPRYHRARGARQSPNLRLCVIADSVEYSISKDEAQFTTPIVTWRPRAR